MNSRQKNKPNKQLTYMQQYIVKIKSNQTNKNVQQENSSSKIQLFITTISLI